MTQSLPRRTVKSFVRRKGRLTPRQQAALKTRPEQYILTVENGIVNYETVFGRTAPIILEIGFGMGKCLISMAQAAPHHDFIGIEIYPAGIGSLLSDAKEYNLANVRIFDKDAMDILPNCIADHSLSAIHIFFPDPWPKKRHHKRRMIQAPFVALLVQKLIPGGRLHLATDWENYAMQMMEVLSANPQLKNTAGMGMFSADRYDRPLTKYEIRGELLGHQVWDLVFVVN